MAPGGYAWWYLDALSDDGTHGLTIIAFIGSVFSPYYAWARRRAPGAADPQDHCAMNVALYGRGGHRWCMTERGSRQLRRSAERLRIGPSVIERHGESLTFCLDEITSPWPSRVHGVVRVHTEGWAAHDLALDAAGRHHWRPYAPRAHVEVHLSAPALHWAGPGYFDSNCGDAPLEDDFEGWHWSRAHLDDGRTAVIYDIRRRDQTALAISRTFDRNGGSAAFGTPGVAALPGSAWRLARCCRSDAGSEARVAQALEDGPFYSRSIVEATWQQRPVRAVHESLSLARFAKPWVQAMLPFKMPKRAG